MTYYPLFLYLKQLSAGERLQRTRGRAERRKKSSTSLRNSENWSERKVGAGFLLLYFPTLKNLISRRAVAHGLGGLEREAQPKEREENSSSGSEAVSQGLPSGGKFIFLMQDSLRNPPADGDGEQTRQEGQLLQAGGSQVKNVYLLERK